MSWLELTKMSKEPRTPQDATIADMSKRIQVTVPDRLAAELEKWADYDGRPLSNLCAYLLEKAVREAQEKGQYNKPLDSKSDDG